MFPLISKCIKKKRILRDALGLTSYNLAAKTSHKECIQVGLRRAMPSITGISWNYLHSYYKQQLRCHTMSPPKVVIYIMCNTYSIPVQIIGYSTMAFLFVGHLKQIKLLTIVELQPSDCKPNCVWILNRNQCIQLLLLSLMTTYFMSRAMPNKHGSTYKMYVL